LNSEPNEESISIGMPVYNGEKFLRTRLNSILNQSFSDFELIISDNTSTDDTSKICEEYAKTDKRIRYIRQQKNMGIIWNFNFVLQQAKNDYFVWAAVDDIWSQEFLENLVPILQNFSNVVCSASKANTHSTQAYDIKDNSTDMFFRKLIWKLRHSLKHSTIITINGSYEHKVRTFLKKSSMQTMYGLFRTETLRRSMITQPFVGIDHAILLNVLKYGDISVNEKKLISIYNVGMSKKGIIFFSRQFNQGKMGLIFPNYPLTAWCIKNLGSKIFFRNIDYFIQLNIWSGFLLFLDLIRTFLNRTSKYTV